MLVLSRKEGEQVVIGDDIKITVLRLGKTSIRIGIEAPKELDVRRVELDIPTAVEVKSTTKQVVQKERVTQPAPRRCTPCAADLIQSEKLAARNNGSSPSAKTSKRNQRKAKAKHTENKSPNIACRSMFISNGRTGTVNMAHMASVAATGQSHLPLLFLTPSEQKILKNLRRDDPHFVRSQENDADDLHQRLRNGVLDACMSQGGNELPSAST